MKRAIAIGATLLASGLVFAAAAAADWNPSYTDARGITANIANDRYGIDASPSDVGCLPHPRRKHVTTRSVSHRWDCVWVATVESDGEYERVCGGSIRITGSDDGEYDTYYTV